MSLNIARMPLSYGPGSLSHTERTERVGTQAKLKIIPKNNPTAAVSSIIGALLSKIKILAELLLNSSYSIN